MVEGDLTVGVLATDDDGATAFAEHSVQVSNIAPSNPVAELYRGEERLFPDSRGVFTVYEGDNITFWGQADDSSNDLESLVHVWKPDAEHYPEINSTSTGERSTLSGVAYNTSGMHLATLQVFDDDGEATELLIVPIQVVNVIPEISPMTTILGDLEEDEERTGLLSVTPNIDCIFIIGICNLATYCCWCFLSSPCPCSFWPEDIMVTSNPNRDTMVTVISKIEAFRKEFLPSILGVWVSGVC